MRHLRLERGRAVKTPRRRTTHIWASRLVRVGFVACCMVLALWTASVFMMADFRCGRVSVHVSNGFIVVSQVQRWLWSPATGDRESRFASREMEFTYKLIGWPSTWRSARSRCGFRTPTFVWRDPSGWTDYLVHMPFWILLLAAGLPTGILWLRHRRLIQPGCCVGCGYDLRGSINNRCSECGRTIPHCLKLSQNLFDQ